MPERINGVVKWYEPARSYGWIVGADAKEYHLHRSEIEGKIVLLEGERVTFKAGKNTRGLRALDVRREA